MTIFNGKLIEVSRLLPAMIAGDGERSVEELIGFENVKRRDDPESNVFLASLTIDAQMEFLLQKQGFSLSEVAPHGVKLRLRET